MAECKPMMPNLEGEENVIAATQHIVRVLGTSKNLTEEMRKILEDLDNQLSTMVLTAENKEREVSDFEKEFSAIQGKIRKWESDESMIWDSGVDAAAEYLQDIHEAQNLSERLGGLSVKEDGEDNKLLQQVHSVLQTAMARLEEELTHILAQNKQSFEPEHMSFRSHEEEINYEDSFASVEDDPSEDSLRRDSSSKNPEDYIIDLVDPVVISHLNRIVNTMFNSGFDQECCQAYINTRRDALDECLYLLEVEKLSIEEVLRTEWSNLIVRIKKWNRAMKIFLRVYLASEEQLCDQIFGEFESAKQTCFVEISKSPMFQLLTFGEAIAIGPRQPEKLFLILDMYEILSDLLPDVDALFVEEAGSTVRFECREVLKRLGDSVRGTVSEFENAVGSNVSTNPFAGGGIHHLTKYVMNYIKALTGYSGTLNLLFLEVTDEDDTISLMPNTLPAVDEKEYEGETANFSASPMAYHLRSVTSVLESNLDVKSKLYRDVALQQFFLMNNIYYMVQKVKGPELRPLFGNDWIKQHNGKFQQYAMNYERATWNSVLSLLKEEGMCTPGSHSVSKKVLKERFKSFNLAFEEAYRSQTAWLIPDIQLREDLRISVSLKVIQAYRTFMGRHEGTLDSRSTEKYIKYNAEDLESFILDLFEGSPRSLPNSRRR